MPDYSADIVAKYTAQFVGLSDGELLDRLLRVDRDVQDETLRSLIPTNQTSCVEAVERSGCDSARIVAFLLAALSVIIDDNSWIHYNIMKHLNEMVNLGIEEARGPCVVHAFLTCAAFSSEPETRAFAERVLARELVKISPRDAARYAIRAATAGDTEAFRYAIASAARLKVIDVSENSTTLSTINSISSNLKLALECELPLINLVSAEVSVQKLEKECLITLPKPQGDSNHYVFRQAGRRVTVPSVDIVVIKNGSLSIDVSNLGLTQFYLFDSKGRCIEELSHGMKPFLQDVVKMSGSIAMLDDMYSGGMSVSHFLLDRLTRLALYERLADPPDRFLLADSYPYYDQVLDYLNLTSKVMFPPSRRFTIQADEMIISTNVEKAFRHPAHLCAPWAINFLTERFNQKNDEVRPGQRRKLFISRADARGRGILNWDELAPLLRNKGFETVILSGKTFKEQRRIFQSASHIAGVHGAGLTNILFAPSDCKVLEIIPPLISAGSYWLLASALGQPYRAVIGDDPILPRPDYRFWEHNPAYNSRNIRISCEALNDALDAM